MTSPKGIMQSLQQALLSRGKPHPAVESAKAATKAAANIGDEKRLENRVESWGERGLYKMQCGAPVKSVTKDRCEI